MKNCNKQNEKIELVDEKTLVIGGYYSPINE